MFSVLPLMLLQPGQSHDLGHIQSPVSVLLAELKPEALGHSPHGNNSFPDASGRDLCVPTVSIFASVILDSPSEQLLSPALVQLPRGAKDQAGVEYLCPRSASP